MKVPQATGFEIHWDGERGPPILLVGGPPASAELFRTVQARLRPRRTGAIDIGLEPTIGQLAELADRLAAACVEWEASALVAHGMAVPIAWQLPGIAVPRLILSNGPVQALHPAIRVLARLPEAVWKKGLLRPDFASRWLASSLALRRAVVNPYVMEREAVDRLVQDLISSESSRANTAKWVRGLGALLPLHSGRRGQVDAIWGDRDPFHPIAQIEALLQHFPGSRLERIPGGQWLHPEERPWAMADILVRLLEA
jgi:pimeloyl-ACP methyl ester carboxylesterase